MSKALRPIVVSLCVAIAWSVGPSHRVLAQENGQKAFGDSLKGQVVTLQRPLYTVHFIAEGGLGTSPGQYNEPLLVVTPAAVVYKASVRGQDLIDDNVDRLVGQVKTKVASRSSMQRILGSSDDKVKTGNVELSKYDAGEEFLIKDVAFKNTDVMITLSKPFTPKQPATGFTIRLDAKISRELSEQALIRKLLDSVVQPKK